MHSTTFSIRYGTKFEAWHVDPTGGGVGTPDGGVADGGLLKSKSKRSRRPNHLRFCRDGFVMLGPQARQKIKDGGRNESDEYADREQCGSIGKRPVQKLQRRDGIRRSRIVTAGLIHEPGQRKVCNCARQRSGTQNNKGIDPHPARRQKYDRGADDDRCAVTGAERTTAAMRMAGSAVHSPMPRNR